jgi:hypothetical protein
MIQSVCHEEGFTVKFNVCTNDEKKELWIEVQWYTKRGSDTEYFLASHYAEAVDFYNAKCDELRSNGK